MNIIGSLVKISRRLESEFSVTKKAVWHFWSFLAGAILIADVSIAAEYILDTSLRTGYQTSLSRPADPSICDAYRKAVIEYQKKVAPMVCERPRDPALSDFSAPNWRVLDKAESIKLAKALAIFKLRGRLQAEADPAKRESLIQWKLAYHRKGLSEGYLQYEVAEFDIDNVAGNERVFRFKNTSYDCSGTDPKTRPSGNTWIYTFTERDGVYEVIQQISSPAAVQVFFYNGRTYFDSWYWSYSTVNSYRAIFVQEPRRPAGGKIYGATVCRFEYVE